MTPYEKYIISIDNTCIEALKQMDTIHSKVLIVITENKFVGILTIGDIQRAIIKNLDLNTKIADIIDCQKLYANDTDSLDDVKKKMYAIRAELMPVVNKDGSLIEVYFWDDLFGDKQEMPHNSIQLPVVIMAGGKGTRLQPLTNIYPKPLIPIGEKTIVEMIMDKFVSYQCTDFYISVNYKADVIRNYFDFINNPKYHITYFQEEKPMGTAGSLRLLKDQLHSTFFVSNCDILIKENYADILEYHKNNGNDLTVVAALKTYSIPYGTIITGENGILESIEEKPSLTFKINTGLYILEPSVLDEIPDDFFHITHLMEKLQKKGARVGVYPISQNDWVDMGDWKEYLKLVRIDK